MLKRTKKYMLPILMLLVALVSAGMFSAAAEEEVPDPGADEPSVVEPVIDEPSYDIPDEQTPVPDQGGNDPETPNTPEWTEPAPAETQAPDGGGAVQPDDGNSDGGNNGGGYISYDTNDYTPKPAIDEYLDPDKAAGDAQSNNSVKMDKSVSQKTYSTDYTAGVVSWICVGVGIVVILVMLVSTKIQGARMARRRV